MSEAAATIERKGSFEITFKQVQEPCMITPQETLPGLTSHENQARFLRHKSPSELIWVDSCFII